MNYENLNDNLGKFLFGFSILLMGFMIFVVIKFPYISIDEWFTQGIVKLSVNQLMYSTTADVHPPLYYLMLKAFIKVLAIFGINFNYFSLVKIFSIIPYLIIYAYALAKLRKDYGWMASGLFVLSLAVMSRFFILFTTARMYSWALLFLFFSFIFVRNILEENNLKDWILLAIFSSLCAYTAYFVAISSVSIYIILFTYVIIKKRDMIKNWLISAGIGIIVFVPWLISMVGQLTLVHDGFWIKPLTVDSFFNVINYLFISFNFSYSGVILLALLILSTVAMVYKYYVNRDLESLYPLIGVLTVILTLVLSIFISVAFKPIIVPRYVVAVSSLLWFALSLSVVKLDKRIVLAIVVVLLIVGSVNLSNQMDIIKDQNAQSDEVLNLLDKINNNDSIVIIQGLQRYVGHHNLINESKVYTNFKVGNLTKKQDFTPILTKTDKLFVIPDDLNKNSDKHVYILTGINKTFDTDDTFNYTVIGTTMGGSCLEFKAV